jgi:predicted NAD-dependent protein-ADP-ribosyltransferase YbiA (DUF1768 family)
MILNKKICRYEKVNKTKKKSHYKLHQLKPIVLDEEESLKKHKKHHKSANFNYIIPHYDIKIKFVVFNKSSDKPFPGTGNGEEIPENKKDLFKPLSLIHDWRKKLDNNWIAPFELDGYNWQTIEHYYQANKYKKHPDYYHLFTLESNSLICKDPLLANHAGGYEGKINRKKFRPKGIEMDKNFYEKNIRRKVLMNAQYAKFTQHNDLRKVLELTYDAMILEFKLYTTEPMDTLMRVRDVLFN